MQEPPKSVQLVLERLESLDQLEVLLHLAEDPRRAFLPVEVLENTSVREVDLQSVLSALLSKGLIVSADPEKWRLSPDLQVTSGVQQLLSMYQLDPVPLLRDLNRRCIERTRALAARELAQAFLVQRKSGA
jgi:hypothetical protein